MASTGAVELSELNAPQQTAYSTTEMGSAAADSPLQRRSSSVVNPLLAQASTAERQADAVPSVPGQGNVQGNVQQGNGQHEGMAVWKAREENAQLKGHIGFLEQQLQSLYGDQVVGKRDLKQKEADKQYIEFLQHRGQEAEAALQEERAKHRSLADRVGQQVRALQDHIRGLEAARAGDSGQAERALHAMNQKLQAIDHHYCRQLNAQHHDFAQRLQDMQSTLQSYQALTGVDAQHSQQSVESLQGALQHAHQQVQRLQTAMQEAQHARAVHEQAMREAAQREAVLAQKVNDLQIALRSNRLKSKTQRTVYNGDSSPSDSEASLSSQASLASGSLAMSEFLDLQHMQFNPVFNARSMSEGGALKKNHTMGGKMADRAGEALALAELEAALETGRGEREQERAEHRRALDGCRERIAQLEAAQESMGQLQEHVEGLEAEVAQLKEAAEAGHQEQEQLRESIAASQEELSSSEKQRTKLEKTLASRESSDKAWQRDKLKLGRRVAAAEEATQTLQKQKAQMLKDVAMVEEAFHRLAKEKAQLHQQLAAKGGAGSLGAGGGAVAGGAAAGGGGARSSAPPPPQRAPVSDKDLHRALLEAYAKLAKIHIRCTG